MAKRKEAELRGNGAAFYRAVNKKRITALEICELMHISNGKLYALYNSEEWSDKDKAIAAKALGKSVEEIFNSVNNGTHFAAGKAHPNNDQDMTADLLEMLKKSISNEERVTIALERITKVTENLSTIVTDRLASQREGNPKEKVA